MNIQKKQEEELREILTNAKYQNEEYEKEFRFGKFLNKKFQPEISYDLYMRLDHFLRKFTKFIGIEFTISNHYKNYRNVKWYNPEKKLNDLPDENWDIVRESNMVKKQIQKIDIKEYGIRFSLSKEYIVDTISDEPIQMVRKRRRVFYQWDDISFQLSKILVTDTGKIFYEIEIETGMFNNKTFKNFMDFLGTTFLQCYQHTNKVMKDRTYKDILKDYQILVNSKKFIGSKAESLSYKKLSFDSEYAVTDKLDGVRKLLYFRKSRIVVIDYNNFLWILNKEPLSDTLISNYENTVLDTEFFDGKFYVFDVLYFKGVKTSQNLHERINIYSKMVQDLQMDKIVTKQYSFSENLFDNVINQLNNQNSLITDGIILTPVNDFSPPLKYKDGKPNTVDFKIKKQSMVNNDLWKLYCYNSENEEIVYTNEAYNIKGEIFVTKNISSRFTDECIVEFEYIVNQNTFFPIRMRPDKQKGNFIKVVNENLMLDLCPFNLQFLKTPNLTEYDVFFYNINRFRNYFMRCVIKDFKNRGNLLLYSYDNTNILHKIIDNNIRNTTVISKKDTIALNEKKEKITNNKTTKNFSFNIMETLDSDEEFTMCFCMNEYTVYTEEIIKLMKKRLKKNAIVIILVFDEKIDEIIDKDLFVYTKHELVCKDKTSKPILQDVITLLKNQRINLIEEVKYDRYYDAWKYNRNFLNHQESQCVNLYKYLILKNE